MHGVVQSGTGENVLPLNQARVTLFDVASGWPAVAGEAKTDRSGAFTIDAPSPEGLFYATANLGNGIVLMTLIGPTLPASIAIDELTTVTAVYCAAPFIERRKLEGDPAGLRAAMEKCASLTPDETCARSRTCSPPASAIRRQRATAFSTWPRHPRAAAPPTRSARCTTLLATRRSEWQSSSRRTRSVDGCGFVGGGDWSRTSDLALMRRPL